MSNLQPSSTAEGLCSPVKGFVWLSLGSTVVNVVYILTTCPYFDDL